MRLPLVLLSLLGVISGAYPANAQTLTVTLSRVVGGDRGELTGAEAQQRGIDRSACGDPTSFVELQVQNPSGAFPNTVDLWHDAGQTSAMCQEASPGRLPSADMRTCVHLSLSDRAVENRIFRLPIAELAAGDSESGDGADVCTRDRTSYTLYLFDTTADPFTAEVGSTAWGRVAIPIDGTPPPAPEVDTATLSGARPPASWTAVTEAGTPASTMRYEIWRTPDCGAVTDLSSSTFVRELAAGVTTTNLDVSDLALGDMAGFVVVAVDLADNVSAPSDTICVTNAQTVGFCDVREGGCPDGCSAGATRAGGTAAALVFLSLLFARRRKLV